MDSQEGYDTRRTSGITPRIVHLEYCLRLTFGIGNATGSRLHTIGFEYETLFNIDSVSEDLIGDKINRPTSITKTWQDSKGLAMAVHKTEAVLKTRRRIFINPRLIIDGTEIEDN